MRKTTALLYLLALSSFVATPVFASCTEDIKAAEAAVAKATDAAKKADAEKHITEAKSHLAMGHEDVCEQHVTAANAALK
jgi:hypothetical protein